MFRTLYSKIATILLVFFVLLGTAFVVMIVYTTGLYQQEVSQKLNRNLAANIVSDTPFFLSDNQINKQALSELFHHIMVINPRLELYLLDPQGKILTYSADPKKVKRDRVDLAPIKTWLAGAVAEPHYGGDPRNLTKGKIFSVAPVPAKGELQGYLYIILGGEEYDSAAKKIHNSYVLKLSGWMIGTGLMFALLAALLLFSLLTRRLSHLAERVDTFRRKDAYLDNQNDIKLPPGDEIDTLSGAFKAMSNRIEDQIEELRKSDSLRRELVANVSHDLRTPLATLRGYIETIIIKDTEMPLEERRKYLKIAINHCERLSKLIEDLFELARLDSQEVRVDPEPFNLAELLQDVLQKFQLEAESKNIILQADLDDRLPFVRADIALIERVFENLLKNALRHTPEGGTIELALTPTKDDIIVRIKDNGAGISPEALPYIFDRFYQVGGKTGGANGVAGLGLAITKRILELHGKTIVVESALEIGSTFSFQLPQ